MSALGCTRKETETDSTQGARRKSRPSAAQQERAASQGTSAALPGLAGRRCQEGVEAAGKSPC
nr:MAG TPA: hypothetical protein [Caudoviricetes sp.]